MWPHIGFTVGYTDIDSQRDAALLDTIIFRLDAAAHCFAANVLDTAILIVF